MDTQYRDLFPGFDSRILKTSGARIFTRTGGSGPPLLLLHGFPQCHVMWHKIAPVLAEKFNLIIADLRGYGQSSCPHNDDANLVYSKRSMALDMAELMTELGHKTFMVAGHDRGGRVAYRLALDHPGRIAKLAVLDIVPTHAMWQDFSAQQAMKIYHWLFLAQPYPMPETLIEARAQYYQDFTISSWSKAQNLSAFDPAALAAYHAFYSKPEHIHATCNDYRAGQTCDLEMDKNDLEAGHKIACPVLALWGHSGIPAKGQSPLDIWRQWASDLRGHAIDSGHFVAEENPDATARALLDFLS